MERIEDLLGSRIDNYTYRLKKIRTPHGELREFTESDENVEFILNWKGTGETKKFSEIMEEHLKYNFDITMLINEGKKPEQDYLWLVDYIVKMNYQIFFEKDDITLRHACRM